MKVFLCGGGSGKIVADAMRKFESLLDKSKPLLYVPLAMESSRYDSCLAWITNEMSLINVKNIEMVTSENDLFSKKLDDYCAIFIGGGNTYKLLKDLKNSKSFDKIKNFINNDGIVFGGSAGAIIFGKDINSCRMQDKNDVGLKDTKGFNIIKDYSLLCHLNRNDGIKFNRNKNSDYLLDFSKENKTIFLPDDDTIFVTDNEIKIIGNSDYEVYKNRKCEIVINDKKEQT